MSSSWITPIGTAFGIIAIAGFAMIGTLYWAGKAKQGFIGVLSWFIVLSILIPALWLGLVTPDAEVLSEVYGMTEYITVPCVLWFTGSVSYLGAILGKKTGKTQEVAGALYIVGIGVGFLLWFYAFPALSGWLYTVG